MSPWTTPARLQREWVLCAMAAAASRFIPVPLVDDAVKSAATRTALARTWAAHGHPEAPREALDVLVGDAGFWDGVRHGLARLPVTLLLYPWRKFVRLVRAVRGVSTDLVGVVLLARAVDRCLANGWFATTEPEPLRQQAQLVWQAHRTAVHGVDLRLVTHAVRSGLAQVHGISRQAAVFARATFARRTTNQLSGPLPAASGEVEQGAQAVQAALARPDVRDLLAQVDARFDAALAAASREHPGQTVFPGQTALPGVSEPPAPPAKA